MHMHFSIGTKTFSTCSGSNAMTSMLEARVQALLSLSLTPMSTAVPLSVRPARGLKGLVPREKLRKRMFTSELRASPTDEKLNTLATP